MRANRGNSRSEESQSLHWTPSSALDVRMMLSPVSRDVDTAADPHIPTLYDMIEEALEPRGASRSAHLHVGRLKARHAANEGCWFPASYRYPAVDGAENASPAAGRPLADPRDRLGGAPV